MKMLLLAATAALTLGSATAFAGDNGADWTPPQTTATTQYQAPQAQQPAAQQPSQHTGMYYSRSSDSGSWLFNPAFGGGGNG